MEETSIFSEWATKFKATKDRSKRFELVDILIYNSDIDLTEIESGAFIKSLSSDLDDFKSIYHSIKNNTSTQFKSSFATYEKKIETMLEKFSVRNQQILDTLDLNKLVGIAHCNDNSLTCINEELTTTIVVHFDTEKVEVVNMSNGDSKLCEFDKAEIEKTFNEYRQLA